MNMIRKIYEYFFHGKTLLVKKPKPKDKTLNQQIRSLPKYSRWRSRIFKRDNYTCQRCGKNRCYVEAHHKQGVADLIKKKNLTSIAKASRCKKLWLLSNGITLCKECHTKTYNYGNKK